jgi:hypothetical protein
MSRTAIVIAALALTATLPAISAHAAARARVFVASYGSDSNPCTFGSPCKTFQVAVDAVAAGGEVTAIDSAGFGPIVINKAVTITSPNGVEAGVVTAAGGTAISIKAGATDTVVLRGLTIAGGNSATIGIDVEPLVGKVETVTGKLEIVDCVIRDFLGEGINLFTLGSIATNTMLVHISNTKVMNNAGTGIAVSTNSGGIVLDLNNITVVDNDQTGLSLQGRVNGTIANSDISNNGLCNVTAGSASSIIVAVALRNLTLGSTAGPGIGIACSVNLDGNASLYMSQVVGGGLTQQNSSNAVFSDGTNQFVGSPEIAAGS